MPHRGENKRFSTLRCTKTGSTQPKLSAACFVVQSCLADADFVVFSNYCLIGTRLKAGFFRYVHRQHIQAAHGAAAGYDHSIAHAHANAAYQHAGEPVVYHGGRGHGYEGGGQGEHRGKYQGAQKEASPEALEGDYEYGYAQRIVDHAREVYIAQRYAVILHQHGP